jgi:hypothetical protein
LKKFKNEDYQIEEKKNRAKDQEEEELQKKEEKEDKVPAEQTEISWYYRYKPVPLI